MSDLVPVTEALPEPTPTTVFDWLDASVPVVWAMERRTAEGRQRAGQALWLLRGMLPDGEYGQRVHALAETHEVSERTLRNWRAEAERVLELAPHEATTGHHRKQLPVPRPAETDAAEPETKDQWTRLASHFRNATPAVLRHSIPRPALLGMRQRIDEALGIEATATEKPRKAVKATNESGECVHLSWRHLGVTGYRCADCDKHLGLQRPASGRKAS